MANYTQKAKCTTKKARDLSFQMIPAHRSLGNKFGKAQHGKSDKQALTVHERFPRSVTDVWLQGVHHENPNRLKGAQSTNLSGVN